MADKIIEPYLFYGGRCDEALKFYGDAIGAQVDFLMRYKDKPDAVPPGRLPKGYEDKVMHASFHVGAARLMASDGCGDPVEFKGFTLSLALKTEAEAKKAFDALAAGGKVDMPLTKTFWSPCFGMLTDKFGVSWMVTLQT